MSDEIQPTRRPDPGNTLLRNKFFESIAAQDEQMSKVAGQLLTVELAIPGLYATALQLVHGEAGTLQLNPAFYLTYGFWLFALGATLAALIPRKWKVNPDVYRQDPARLAEGLGIQDFFFRTAQYKRRLLILSSILFFCGILSAGFTI